MNMPTRSMALSCLFVAAGMTTAAPRLAAAENYPNRTIKIVVPVPPGPLLDVVPRIIGEKLSAKWGVPVIIENRPGAAQHLGAEAVAKSEPDGYTLLASPPGPLVVSQHIRSKLGFDPSAFVPVSVMVKFPMALVAHPKVPASNLQAFLAYAKANTSKLNYGSPGVGSPPHLAAEQLMKAAGISFAHVPYQGMAPAMNDLIAGHIDVMIDVFGNAWPNVKEGKLKLLAVTSPARLPEAPDVATVAETLPGYAHVEWFAIVAPPKTPAHIATKLSAAIAETLKLPDVAKRLRDYVLQPVGSSPSETADFVKGESERWRKVIEATGLKIN